MQKFHCWEQIELVFTAQSEFANPYMDVDVWVDLKGPGFEKRVYGFWDGGQTYKVRVAATAPGAWSYVSGSAPQDGGLSGVSGSFEAEAWGDVEKNINPNRRGFLRATPNQKAFCYADGTPFYMIADTWWSVPTFRFPWKESDDRAEFPDAVGPKMSFQDYVAYRKKQGYNGIAMLAAHPAWAEDGYPATVMMDDEKRTVLRSAWESPGKGTSKNMHNEGGRPFFFPGNVPGYEDLVPDFTRINPDYFRFMDRKVKYLCDQGFVPFIEVARRDISQAWKKFGGWPQTYTKYVQYVFARYHALNTLLSPIHFDTGIYSIDSREYNEPINACIDRYGMPPFGTLLGTNAAPATIDNFGDETEQNWLTFHQLGNWREHDHYWYITEMWRDDKPTVSGEPYYPGFPDDNPKTNTENAELNCRSGVYGSFLSGALAGYFYGCEGIWGSDVEEAAKYKMWEAIQFRSGAQVPNLFKFMGVLGDRYVDLVPDSEMVSPNKAGAHMGYRGWAYCAYLPGKDELLLYFEKECPATIVRRVKAYGVYELTWFNPRTGEWEQDENNRFVTASQECRVEIPYRYEGNDWGLYMKRVK